mmetsp:Transcript_32075/g.23699  ORF Transcript_32075/g.23699 Transcript_32075/m.23699 type:complete len:87 (-) Transcript_32075:44-304(-)
MLVFGELGDKSQITAIVLAATYSPISVIVGGAIAFTLNILLAIVVGQVIQKSLNEKWLNLFSGILFLGFGTYMLITKIILEQNTQA